MSKTPFYMYGTRFETAGDHYLMYTSTGKMVFDSIEDMKQYILNGDHDQKISDNLVLYMLKEGDTLYLDFGEVSGPAKIVENNGNRACFIFEWLDEPKLSEDHPSFSLVHTGKTYGVTYENVRSLRLAYDPIEVAGECGLKAVTV